MNRFIILTQGIDTVLGTGTEANPYQIRTAKQLRDLAVCVNGGNDCSTKYYVQTADIDLSAYDNWTPIGNDSSTRFNGIYDGNGYTIRNLIIKSGSFVGLFGQADTNSVIKNVCVLSGDITNTNYACAIVCLMRGILSQCINYATVKTTGTLTNIFTGGICCILYGTGSMSDCINGGIISHKSTGTGGGVGGICFSALTGASLSKCLNYGAVSSDLRLSNAVLAAGAQNNCYFNNETSLAPSALATGRTTANCQGLDALTDASKLNGLGTNWFARLGDYPLPIRFKK